MPDRRVTADEHRAPCLDCGQDTTPLADPGDVRVEDGCWVTYRKPIIEAGTWEWYILRPAIWDQALGYAVPAYEGDGGEFLCIGCLAERLGRDVRPDDFDWTVPANDDSSLSTERLRRAQGYIV